MFMGYSGLTEFGLQDEAVSSHVSLTRGQTFKYHGEFSVASAEFQWSNLILVVVLKENN